jgi:hypothetical protein
MDSSMQLWKRITSILCAIALAACARAPGALAIRSANVDAGVLSAHVDWQPDAQVLAALDHGIALDFIVTVAARTPGALGSRTAQQQRHLQLRYFPLSRQYQLRDLDLAQTRSFAARALILAAFEDLRLPLPGWDAHGAKNLALDIELDRDTLPGALRLPALLHPAWHLSSGDYTWQAPAG